MTKEIRITCKGAAMMPLSDIVELQGNLKELSKENYDKLKASIIKHGFADPIGVARLKGEPHGMIDGHQRHRTIIQMIETEGYTLLNANGNPTDKLPVTYTECKSKKEAAELILQAIAQYGKVTDEGLYEFVTVNKIDIGSLEAVALPDFDVDKFIAGYGPEDAELEDGIDYAVKYAIEVEVANEKEQETTYNKLTDMGYTCKVLTL